MHHRRISLVGIGIMLMSFNMVVAATPSFTPLGDLPGGDFYSFAGAVSGDGSVVAGWSVSDCPTAVCNSEAYLWENGVMAGFGFPQSSSSRPFSGAQAISADGSIFAGSGSSDAGSNEPFRWENGVFTPLGRIPGYGDNAHFTSDMSGDGSRIVGYGYDDDGDYFQAWLWDNGTMIGLGDLDPSFPPPFSYAFGISGDGQVVVGQTSSQNGMQAYRWSDGVMSGLGYLFVPSPNAGEEIGAQSWAMAASTDGAVIVGSSAWSVDGVGEWEAFRWEDGVMVGLGDLAGGTFKSHAKAVSADGSVIAGESETDEGEVAFIWDAAHGMRDLRTVLEDSGLDMTGWTLRFVTDMSADGSVIVGTGINPNGDFEAFRAVVPEPTTVSLLSFVILLCFRKKQRQSN